MIIATFDRSSRRSLIATAIILAVLPAAAYAGDALAKRPNVIILLTDDQGYGDLSCHGHPVLKTPNFDKLHDQSIRLTDFHVAPMCTPTRGQLLTGCDALRTGASSVCAGRSFVRRGTPMMPEVFAANGYRTALFGKWHLGDNYPNLPEQHGFQQAVYHLGWGITSMADVWQNDYFDGRFRSHGELKQYPGYCTDVWFNLAKDWIRERAANDERFFLYLPTNAPHGPLWVPEEYKAAYRDKKGPSAFFGMIANIDDNLGRLDQLLHETGQWDNTILIFFNENGGTAGVKFFNAGMRGHKTEYYEGGHRAACFLRWPAGGLRQPCDIDSLTQVQDLLPTLIELCNLKKPEHARFDGASLAGTLKGTGDTPDRTLVVQYGQRPEKWDSAVMRQKWRLVKGSELYDLASDFAQATDVAAKHADVVKKLRGHYEQWWSEIEPKLDDFNPISIGAEQENPVTLSAADWANVYCDNMKNLREGLNRNGPWHLLVEQDGSYEIELRRWPREADAAITAGVPEFQAVDGKLPPGKALPIVKMRLKLGEFDQSQPVSSGDKGVTFTLPLKAGTREKMQTWCYDAEGKELCGAYFAYVRWVEH
jgi:arylsulfatase A-like enzyme